MMIPSIWNLFFVIWNLIPLPLVGVLARLNNFIMNKYQPGGTDKHSVFDQSLVVGRKGRTTAPNVTNSTKAASSSFNSVNIFHPFGICFLLFGI